MRDSDVRQHPDDLSSGYIISESELVGEIKDNGIVSKGVIGCREDTANKVKLVLGVTYLKGCEGDLGERG